MPSWHLTDRFIQNLTAAGTRHFRPARGGRLEVGDLRVQGLSMRVTPRGLKSWSFNYKLAGRQRRITLGRYPQMGLREARDAALALRDDLYAGLDPGAPPPGPLTFDDAAQQYLERSLIGRVRHPGLWRGVVAKHAVPVWGGRPLAAISRGDCHALIDAVKAGTGPGAAREVRKCLHQLFEWCVDRELLPANPMHRLKRPDLAAPVDVRRPLTDNQIRDVWQLPGSVGLQLRMILLTGARKGEIGLSEWRDFDFAAGTLTISATRHKSGRTTTLYLSSAALDILAAQAQHSQLNMPPPGAPRAAVLAAVAGRRGLAFREGYLRDTRLALVQRRLRWRLRPHDLRATAATRMAALGVRPDIIQHALGQVPGGLFRTYAKHGYEAEQREAMEQYGTYIKEIVADGQA